MVTPDHKLQAICTNCKFKYSVKNMGNCPRCDTPFSEMKNPSIIDILYYHCSKSKGKCSQGSITRDEIDSVIEKSIGEISISKDYYQWSMNRLKDGNNKVDIQEDEKIIKGLLKKKTELGNRLFELVNLLADCKINSEQFNLSTSKTQKEIFSIEYEIEEISNRNIRWFEETKKDYNLMLNVLEKFKNGGDLVKTEIARELSSNLILMDKKLYFTMKKSFFDIKKNLTLCTAKN